MTANSDDADVTSQLLAFVEGTSDLVGVVDEQSRVVYLNRAARKRLGVGDPAGLTTADLFPPDTFSRYYDEVRPALLRSGSWHGELAVLTGSGEAVPMTMTVVARVGPGGEVTGLVTHGREIDTTLGPAPTAAALVHDELTGLAGPAILDDRIRVALARADRDGRRVAAIAVGVDAMKDINDSFGHSVGDDVLRGLARATVAAVRPSDTVARVGGDEFVVLIDGLDEADMAAQFAERLHHAACRVAIETPLDPVVATVSFGLAVATSDDEPTSLLHRANSALARAKTMGGAKVVAHEALADVGVPTLPDELAVAVSHGQIRPHVQPVVDLNRGVLVGYQGLARWQHPQRGLLEADQFVHEAANTPMLPVVDLAVLRRTAAAAARAARGGLHLRVYGHLSRRLIGDADLERYLTEIVDDLGIAPSDLCVEVSQALIARPPRRVERLPCATCAKRVSGRCSVPSTANARSITSSNAGSTSFASRRASSTMPRTTRYAGAWRKAPSRSPARSVSP